MAPRKTSQAWLHFSRIEDNPDSAKCNICGNVYKRGGGTKNLLDHLQRFHREVLQDGAIAPNGAGGPALYEDNNPKKKELDKYLLRLFAKDYQPFRIVEDDGFVQLVKALDPRYKLPCRQTISSKLIPDVYQEVKQKLKTDLTNVKRVALTLDTWTSISQDAYLAVTVHYIKQDQIKAACLDCVVLPGSHTAENIKNAVLQIITEWQLNNKVTAVVTDNDTNVVAAVRLLNLRHLPCAAHTLNLVVNDGVNQSPYIKDLLERCSAIVTFFKHSNLATEKLKAKRSAANKIPLRLVQQVATRWNSKLAMIRRLLEMRDELILCLFELPNAPQGFDGNEWQILGQLETILRSYEEMTNILSGELYVTASLIIPLTKGLLKTLDNIDIDRLTLKEEVREFLDKIKQATIDRMPSYEQRSVAKGATFMNPQFKKAAFVSEIRADEARLQIESEVKTLLNRIPEPTQEPANDAPTPTLYTGLLSFLNDTVSTSTGTRSTARTSNINSTSNSSSTVEAAILVRQYVELQPIDNQRDPISYWSNVDVQLKVLADNAAYYLCVPATSVPSERLFSKAGYLMTARRNSLSPAKSRMLVFLHGNNAFV